MSKTQSLLKLYRAYVTDLVSVAPEKGGVFVCPICLGEFKENDVINKRLTDGHVWPEYVRKKSKQTNQVNQRVLLCAECNTKSGSRGDKQMQLLERVREGEERGDIYGDRTIEVPINPGEKPIRLKGRIRRKSPNSMTITGELKDGKWVGASPDDFQRFKALLDQRISFPDALCGYFSTHEKSLYPLAYIPAHRPAGDAIPRRIISALASSFGIFRGIDSYGCYGLVRKSL